MLSNGIQDHPDQPDHFLGNPKAQNVDQKAHIRKNILNPLDVNTVEIDDSEIEENSFKEVEQLSVSSVSVPLRSLAAKHFFFNKPTLSSLQLRYRRQRNVCHIFCIYDSNDSFVF